MKATSRLLAGAMLLALFTPNTLAQDGGTLCPDVRARAIDARVDWSQETERCGFGIRIFGLGGGIFGPKCPDKKFIYPAHQACRGDEHPGTWCDPGGFLDVDVEGCECVEATVFGTGLLIPSCECTAEGSAGHVQDARTEVCSIDT